MLKFEIQSTLFAAKVSRHSLYSLQHTEKKERDYSVNIWRNHSFEPLIPLIEPYCAYGDWHANFRLGSYDDSLMFSDYQSADLELLWLDSDRYLSHTLFSDWLVWLEGRLQVLRNLSNAPIILATWSHETRKDDQIQVLTDHLPAVYFANLQSVCDEESVPLFDKRTATLAGTSISSLAQLLLAKKLACHWLPAALMPPIKAVALDLDNTLHCGILGEDGINGVELTSGHVELQEYIKSLHQRGIFIALVSRNVREDVATLFAKRLDYPLRWEDFSVIEVSWGDKADALERIAKALRIAPDAVLFVDDNLGELANVYSKLPQVHTIFAHSDANLTRHVVYYYPGLWRWKVESDDNKRVHDLKVSSEREALSKSYFDPAEYIRSLQVSLVYSYDSSQQLNRLADLCNKTNQFNLALRRFNQVDIAKRMDQSNSCVSGIHLFDRLSDSGVIAVIVAERHGEKLIVEELCISCRALGRHLENNIIFFALRNMPIFSGCTGIAFRVQHGPRNQPALEWITNILDLNEMPSPGLHVVPASYVLNFVAIEGNKLNKE